MSPVHPDYSTALNFVPGPMCLALQDVYIHLFQLLNLVHSLMFYYTPFLSVFYGSLIIFFRGTSGSTFNETIIY